MNSKPIRILCVDDHVFLVEGLRSRLALERDMEFVAHLESAERLVVEAAAKKADVVLLDIEMPGPDPFEMLQNLKTQLPDIKVIMLSAFVRNHYLDSAIKAGAWGYLSKSDDSATVVDAIRKVMGGEFAFGPKVLERCQPQGIGRKRTTTPTSKLDLLTTRERQILRMIGKGMSRVEIADSLHRSPKTVDNHRAAIMGKLEIRDRVELARYAIQEGLSEI